MSKPLVVTIPHNLGKEEALRRIQGGLLTARTRFAGSLVVRDERWTGDHLDFHVAALRQEVKGTIDVGADAMSRCQVELPWVLAALAEKAKTLVDQAGHADAGKEMMLAGAVATVAAAHRRPMANCLDVVVIGVEHECAVVVRMVMRPDAGRAVVDAAGGERGPMEGIDDRSRFGAKTPRAGGP